jgi:hypothetical protein
MHGPSLDGTPAPPLILVERRATDGVPVLIAVSAIGLIPSRLAGRLLMTWLDLLVIVLPWVTPSIAPSSELPPQPTAQECRVERRLIGRDVVVCPSADETAEKTEGRPASK